MSIKFLLVFITLLLPLAAQQRQQVAVCIPAAEASSESVQSLIESGRRHFCRLHDVQYFVLSATPPSVEDDDVEWLSAGVTAPFKLFQALQANKTLLLEYNYLFVIDPKMVFAASVGDEVFGELIAVQRVNSTLKKPVFSSSFFGGKPHAVFDLIKISYRQTDAGINNELLINRCFKEKPPTRILSPSYTYPENCKLEYAKKIIESRG
jgi:hypothetical protein